MFKTRLIVNYSFLLLSILFSLVQSIDKLTISAIWRQQNQDYKVYFYSPYILCLSIAPFQWVVYVWFRHKVVL